MSNPQKKTGGEFPMTRCRSLLRTIVDAVREPEGTGRNPEVDFVASKIAGEGSFWLENE
jgi:hypothetical protein